MRWMLAWLCGLAVVPSLLAAEPFPKPFVDTQLRLMPRIQPGTVVSEHQSHGWSELVTMVHPRLAAGAVDAVPDYAASYADLAKFTILADVKQAEVDGRPQYWLDKIGIGFAVDVKGKSIVISSETAEQFGADLGMIGKRVFSGNEECLKDIVQVIRTERLVMFDAESNMTVGEKHEMMVMRYLIWVSPNSGKLGVLVWLLDENPDGSYRLVGDTMQLLPSAFHEDRIIHVTKGNMLSSMLPKPEQFAVLQLPQGTPVPLSPTMQQVAVLKTFTRDQIAQLATGMGQSLALAKQRVANRNQ